VFPIGSSRDDDLHGSDDLPRELRLALWMRQISLEYQPIVDLSTGDLAGVEAYVRWDRPGHGVVPARSFVDEAAGALAALDQEVLWVSTSLWASLGGAGAHVPLHVNVAMGGATKRLAGLVGRALNETTLDPSLLQIDVPDSLDPQNIDDLRGLEGLAEHGVAVNLDDSGSHDAFELSRLVTSLPVTAIKLDLRADERSRVRVETVAEAASRAGVEVAAKAVEDLDDLERASACGVRQAQGYLLGRPVSPDACVELLMIDQRSRMERAS
jgi:EAL domain-containing protein (putative c-di-GMP-specific phosphodiesterase class I)